jgi:hypothetical protein
VGYGCPAYGYGYGYPAYGYDGYGHYRHASVWNGGQGGAYIYDYPAHSFRSGYGAGYHRRHLH